MDRSTLVGLPVSGDKIWAQMVDGCYKGQIYGMGTTYSRSYSPDSMAGVGLAKTDVEDIRDRVHAVNELMQQQLEEADKRYMLLYEQYKRDKEQWIQ